MVCAFLPYLIMVADAMFVEEEMTVLTKGKENLHRGLTFRHAELWQIITQISGKRQFLFLYWTK